jgi:hypothetical protein
VLVASATIDGHAVALRLERADTLTLLRWVDVRPVMPWCQELTAVHTPNSEDARDLKREAKVDIIMNCEATAREQIATATPRHFATRVSATRWWRRGMATTKRS